MADQIFRYAGPSNVPAPYGDPFVVKDSWTQPAALDPDWVKKVWITQLEANGYVPQQPPLIPTYDEGTVSWPGSDGKMVSIALNPMEFPTRETVDQLALRYAINGVPLTVLEFPFLGLGPVTSNAVQRLVQFPNDATLPAFQLANYYTNNPEDIKLNVADSLCKLLIARVWQPEAPPVPASPAPRV